MHKLTPFFLALAGCAALSNPTSPPIAPVDAALAVKVDLSMAAENAGIDEVVAAQSWARAYDMFELQIEPEIRQVCGRRTAAEIEYAFGSVRAALADPDATTDAIDRVQASIEECMQQMTHL